MINVLPLVAFGPFDTVRRINVQIKASAKLKMAILLNSG